MPYEWISSASDTTSVLHLWPHQSLVAKGYFRLLLATAVLISLPLFSVLGTFALWGLLPFLLLALFGLKLALDRNRSDQHILEILTLSAQDAQLQRHNPHSASQSWQCNRHWATVHLHKTDGPVPNYVTLRGNGREVEIGAFLSEKERRMLFDDLNNSLRLA